MMVALLWVGVVVGARYQEWTFGHISGRALSQISMAFGSAFVIQALVIGVLRLWAWLVESGRFENWHEWIARQQKWIHIPSKPTTYTIMPTIRMMNSSEDVTFLGVRKNVLYLNHRLKQSFQFLPPGLQRVAFVPIGFLRNWHERAGHFTPLNKLPWVLNEVIAHNLFTFPILWGVVFYAVSGEGWIPAIVGTVFGLLLLKVLQEWGKANEFEELNYHRAVERFKKRLGIERLSDEEFLELRQAADMMHKMIPKAYRTSLPAILDKIESTNIVDPDRLHKAGNLITENLIPPTYVFRAEVLSGYEGVPPKQIAMTLDKDFVALTSVSSGASSMSDVVGKGGVRWYQVGQGRPVINSFMDKVEGRSGKAMLPEDLDLAATMGDKNPWADVFFDGGKTVILAKENANKLRVIHRWAASSMLAGVLCNTYIAGPDMGMGEPEMSEIVSTTDQLQESLPHRFRRRVLSTTSRNETHGSYPHEEWTVTSISVVDTLLTALEDPTLQKQLGLDSLEWITVAIQGYGDVGSGVVRYLADLKARGLYPELFKRLKFVGISDMSGGIYNAEGLNIESLLRLRDLQRERIKVKEPFKLVDEYKDPHTRMKSEDVLFMGATIVIPAATPDAFKNRGQIERLYAAGTKILCEGANNSVKAGLEELFFELGVFFAPGAVANFGGVYTSTQEWLDVMMMGEVEVRRNMKTRKGEVQREIQEIARENMQTLLKWSQASHRSIVSLHRDAVELMRIRRTELLDELNLGQGSEDARGMVATWTAKGLPENVARMITATTLARKEILAYEAEAIRSPNGPANSARSHDDSLDAGGDIEASHPGIPHKFQLLLNPWPHILAGIRSLFSPRKINFAFDPLAASA